MRCVPWPSYAWGFVTQNLVTFPGDCLWKQSEDIHQVKFKTFTLLKSFKRPYVFFVLASVLQWQVGRLGVVESLLSTISGRAELFASEAIKQQQNKMIREFCGILRGSNLPQILVVTILLKASPALKGIRDSLGFWIPSCGFRIFFVSGTRIPDSLSWIPDSTILEYLDYLTLPYKASELYLPALLFFLLYCIYSIKRRRWKQNY